MLTRIDEAFLSKVKKWFPNTIYANTAIVYNTAYQLVDNPTLELKFPLISIYRPEGFTLVPTQTLSAKRRGYKYFQGTKTDNVARYLTMNLIYQLDIYAKTPEVLNKITTNIMYAFTLDPTLKVIQENEHDPEAPFIDEYEINYNNGASEHSEFQSGDRVYHYAIAYEIKNAKLYNFIKEGSLIIDIEGNIRFIKNGKTEDGSVVFDALCWEGECEDINVRTLVDALCWEGTCEGVSIEYIEGALDWRKYDEYIKI